MCVHVVRRAVHWEGFVVKLTLSVYGARAVYPARLRLCANSASATCAM